jgi:hypothetical protein
MSFARVGLILPSFRWKRADRLRAILLVVKVMVSR